MFSKSEQKKTGQWNDRWTQNGRDVRDYEGMKIRKWEENITESGQVKREGKSIYYAIRFHAEKHSIPSSVQLTIPLFRRNSPHSPRRMKGEGGWGKGFFIPVRLHCSFPGSSIRSLHFGFQMRNLQEWMGYLYLSRADPSPRAFCAGTHETLGRRGSSFLLWLPQLTFSPAALCFCTEIALHCLYVLQSSSASSEATLLLLL